MGKHTDQRDRTLRLTTILQKETDEKHPMSLTQLRERLAELGSPAERKSIYRDLSALRRHGMDVVFRPGNDGGWYLNQRSFSLGELRAIADAIAVYPHISRAQRETLLEKLKGLASNHQRARLHRPVALSRQGEDLQPVLDRLHTACQEGKALSFIPYRYDQQLKKVPAGERQLVSPKGLLWTGQGYRLLGWDHRTQRLCLLRPEQMGEVLVTGMPVQGPVADPALWAAVPFGLDLERRERVLLLCQEDLAEEVVDRFGPTAQAEPQGTGFLLSADVVVGPEFWAWLDAHSGQVEVVGPSWAARQWQERCCFPLRQAAV